MSGVATGGGLPKGGKLDCMLEFDRRKSCQKMVENGLEIEWNCMLESDSSWSCQNWLKHDMHIALGKFSGLSLMMIHTWWQIT